VGGAYVESGRSLCWKWEGFPFIVSSVTSRAGHGAALFSLVSSNNVQNVSNKCNAGDY